MAGDVLIDKMETNMSGLTLNATFVRLPSHLCAWTWIFSRTMFTVDLLTSVWNLLNWMCFSCDLTGRKSWNQINNGGWSLLSLAGDWFSCETVLCHHLAFNTPNISQPWFFLAPCCRSLAWLAASAVRWMCLKERLTILLVSEVLYWHVCLWSVSN